MKVTGDNFEGRIEGSFGKSGKIRIEIVKGEVQVGKPIDLIFKKSLYEHTKRIYQ